MKRTALVLLGATLFFSLGFTTTESPVSKIYVYGNRLIRSNTSAGRIDFFDLRQPSTLPKLGSLNVAGNNDVAVVDNIMFADAGRDLILFDITDVTNIRAIDTIKAVFNQLYRTNSFEGGVISEPSGGFSGCGGCNEAPVSAPTMASSERSTGTAGSLARFAIAGNHLYCIDFNDVIVFDIEVPTRPQLKNRAAISWDIETLFPYRNSLFVGGARGMYIVDISDPDAPRAVSQFQHGRGCDPVVVEGDRAYVTLRGGGPCGETRDQLHVIDIRNLYAPQLLKTIDVENPYGLAVRENIVYLCDGEAGLKVIDTRDLEHPNVLSRVTDIVPHDAILLENHLVVTTSDRAIVYQLGDAHTPVAVGSISLLE